MSTRSNRVITALDTEKHAVPRTSSRHTYRSNNSEQRKQHPISTLSSGHASFHTTSSSGDDLSSSDEFGGAEDTEEADMQFLRDIKQDYQDEMQLSTPTLLWVTPSQLQSRLPNVGLDKEKHDDMTDLRRNSLSFSLSKSSRNLILEPDEDNEIDDSSDEEFGDADSKEEAPKVHRLRDSGHSMCRPAMPTRGLTRSGLLAPKPPPPDPTPALDKDKHEEIGHLLDSRHARGIHSTRNTRTTLTWENTSDEFGDAHSQEAPDSSYLQDAQEELLERESGNPPFRKLKVTPSQLQAHIPSGLDNEKHDDIGDLMDSLRVDGFEEFEDSSLHDTPQRRFLYDSTHSSRGGFSDIDEDEILNNSGEIVLGHHGKTKEQGKPVNIPAHLVEEEEEDSDKEENDEGSLDYEPLKGGDFEVPLKSPQENNKHLDAEKHDDLGTLRKNRTSLTGSSMHSEDYDEFGQANNSDRPDRDYLEEGRADIAHDEKPDHDDIEYPTLKGGDGLDSEAHEDLGTLRKTRTALLGTISDDEDEFGSASLGDTPNNKYLMRQNSEHSVDDSLPPLQGYAAKPTSNKGGTSDLDGDVHDDLETMRTVRSMSESEFGSASTLDAPNASFLRSQLSSMQDDEFENLSELAEEETTEQAS